MTKPPMLVPKRRVVKSQSIGELSLPEQVCNWNQGGVNRGRIQMRSTVRMSESVNVTG